MTKLLRGLRGLGGSRALAMKDETTSPARQEGSINGEAALLGVEMVGWARDLNVSASEVEPFSTGARTVAHGAC